MDSYQIPRWEFLSTLKPPWLPHGEDFPLTPFQHLSRKGLKHVEGKFFQHLHIAVLMQDFMNWHLSST